MRLLFELMVSRKIWAPLVLISQKTKMITLLTSKTRSSLVNAIVGSGYSLNVPKYISWGTGSGTVQATDVALFNPVQVPVSGTVSTVTTTTSGDTYLCSAVLTASGACAITNIGLFDSGAVAPVGILTSQINPGATTIQISGYSSFPSSFPFNIQVLSEVMTVTSGNGTNTYNVIRGANGSSIVTTIIPSLTPVVGQAGNMFLKSSFSGIGLQYGDSIQFNISVQFI